MINEIPYFLRGKKVMVCGYKGMIGSALVRKLEAMECTVVKAGRDNVDFMDARDTISFFEKKEPDAVFMVAARVGGIYATQTRPAEYFHENMAITLNTIHAAHQSRAKKFMFLGSTSMYPKGASLPFSEDSLWSGPLTEASSAFSVTKLAGLKMCQSYRQQYGADFITVIPSNVYGPGDYFDLSNSHVLAALIRKAHEAKDKGVPELEVWGSGKASRELMYVDDLAEALIFLMEKYTSADPINVGVGGDVTIKDIAEKVCKAVGYTGKIVFDPTKPDGALRKYNNISKLEDMGFKSKTSLDEGIAKTYAWFLENIKTARGIS